MNSPLPLRVSPNFFIRSVEGSDGTTSPFLHRTPVVKPSTPPDAIATKEETVSDTRTTINGHHKLFRGGHGRSGHDAPSNQTISSSFAADSPLLSGPPPPPPGTESCSASRVTSSMWQPRTFSGAARVPEAPPTPPRSFRVLVHCPEGDARTNRISPIDFAGAVSVTERAAEKCLSSSDDDAPVEQEACTRPFANPQYTDEVMLRSICTAGSVGSPSVVRSPPRTTPGDRQCRLRGEFEMGSPSFPKRYRRTVRAYSQQNGSCFARQHNRQRSASREVDPSDSSSDVSSDC